MISGKGFGNFRLKGCGFGIYHSDRELGVMGFFSEGAVDLGLIKLLGPCPRSVLRVRFSLYGKGEGFVRIGAGLNVFLSIAGPFEG